VDDRDRLLPREVLGRLLDARVEEADLGRAPYYRLAFELQDEPEHAVGARMVRANRKDHAVAVQRFEHFVALMREIFRTTRRHSLRPQRSRVSARGTGLAAREWAAAPSLWGLAAGSLCAGGARPSYPASRFASGSDGP